MATKVVMPQVGLTTEEATIVQWLKNEGDPVKRGEPLFEVETDKATMTVESPADGILLKIAVPEGGVAKVTETVGLIGEEGEDVSSLLEESGKDTDGPYSGKDSQDKERVLDGPQAGAAKEEAEREQGGRTRLLISPLARRIAREAGITIEELKNVKGTGAGGAIIKRDVLSYLEVRVKAGKEKVIDRIPYTPSPSIPASGEQLVPLTKMRRTIAQRMTQSIREAPQFWLGAEVKADELLNCRERMNSGLPEDRRITVTDLIVKACALALREHPYINATFTDEGIIVKQDINIGVAVAMEEGLIVPVLKGADRKSLSEIAASRRELVKKAREGMLTIDDATGGTFTVSNLGMWGIDEFVAIINPPEAGILAIGRVRPTFSVVNEQMKQVNVISLRLTLDHRVVDGAQGARFLARIKEYLEEPYLLLL
ncbi:dihydrolipoamide acetyltransferase family protein [Neomoorella humiferrea]|uniref:dihydrolipoamide acetyltransferase family protein n=1 Tax=Neomoorella humiferrea TaxID=676965 RepID=UPI003D9171B5